jgi:ankyrin repeat protein
MASHDGYTLLMFAVEAGDPRLTRTLLERGADPSAKTSVQRQGRFRDGRTSFYLEGGESPVIMAARQGDPVLLTLLLGHGASPNDTDAEGNTPLILAAAPHTSAGDILYSIRSPEAVRVLLDASADPNLANREGFRPLDVARARKDSEVVQMLVRHGARGGVANSH